MPALVFRQDDFGTASAGDERSADGQASRGLRTPNDCGRTDQVRRKRLPNEISWGQFFKLASKSICELAFLKSCLSNELLKKYVQTKCEKNLIAVAIVGVFANFIIKGVHYLSLHAASDRRQQVGLFLILSRDIKRLNFTVRVNRP
jgi:hypothetical protein